MDVALEEQGGVATEFLRGLVERFGLTAAIDVQQPDDDTLNIHLTGDDLGLLIGPKGATLLAVQDLTRTVVQRQTGAGNGRIYVDVAGYRQKRSEALARFTTKVAEDVRSSQQQIALEPMSAPDRKVVHDTAAGIPGVSTLSEGEEPRRRVVITPSED
jgi:spoIIIJ-associated protein